MPLAQPQPQQGSPSRVPTSRRVLKLAKEKPPAPLGSLFLRGRGSRWGSALGPGPLGLALGTSWLCVQLKTHRSDPKQAPCFAGQLAFWLLPFVQQLREVSPGPLRGSGVQILTPSPTG